MIYGLMHTIQEDAHVVVDYIQGKNLSEIEEEDQQQRVQVAALRMFAFIGMAFGSLWALSILTFVITVPLAIVMKLATAVGVYVLAHDIFIMSQNAYQQQDLKETIQSRLMGLFRGQEALEEERAQEFTHGTFLQPIWMWAYVNRNQI